MRGFRRLPSWRRCVSFLTLRAAAGREPTPDRTGGSRRWLRGYRIRSLATLALAGALTWGVMAAFALSDTYINLLTSGATVSRGDAVFVQGGIGAGTGNFDPFLTLSPGGSTPTEKGYNTTQASGEFDSFFGGGRTHPIKASAIPAIVNPGGSVPPGTYREFSLDANDQGSDDFMSIDRIRIYLDSQNNLTGYNIGTEAFSSDVAPLRTKIYDLDTPDNAAVLMRSQTLTPGSGVSDITVLVKDSVFPADCFYGSTTCDKFLYFYTESGFERTDPPDSLTGNVNRDFNVTSGFEEWRTRLLPVVAVSKTANTSFDRKFDWTVQKLVSTDDNCVAGFLDANTAGTGLNIDLFNGQSDTVCWKIISDRGEAQDSNIQLTGTITIHNPTGSASEPIQEDIPATINSVTDVVTQGGTSNATVSCGVSFPFTLAPGGTLNCTYSKTLSGTAAGTNRADVVVENGATDLTYSSPSVPFDPLSGTINVVDENASLDDSRSLPGAPIALSGDDTRTYTEALSCPSSRTESNTATLIETDTNTSHTDPAFVNITCHTLSVTKDATPTYTRTFDWTVKKYVSTDDTCTGGFEDGTLSIDLFFGSSDTVCWKIVSDRGDAVDSAFKVAGTITIQNSAPIAANGVSVTDSLAGPVSATVDCDPVTPGNQSTVDIPASSSKQCTYEAFPTDASDRLNTATASLFGQSYQGTALADFGDPTTVIDESSHLDDSRTLPGAPLALSGDDTQTYTESLPCGSSRTESNLATLTEDDSGQIRTDPAAVNLTCVPPPDGCTPGFWKNHTSLWDGVGGNDVTTIIQTTDGFNATFGVTSGFSGLFDSRNLLYALDVSTATLDVSGLDANLAALDRHAAAALVNADASGVNYEFSVAQVIAIYQDAVGFVSGPEDISSALLKLSTANQRNCPLS